jgi:hypothetical protein
MPFAKVPDVAAGTKGGGPDGLLQNPLNVLCHRHRTFAKHLLACDFGAGPKTGARMIKQVLVTSAFIILVSSASEARPSRIIGQASGCNVTMPCDFSYSQARQVAFNPYSQRTHRMERRARRDIIYSREVAETSGQAVGGRPAGCPHSFCGCGASIRVFGRIVPELNLAANWLRFPRAAPAPGMVAARRGHVFVLEQHVEGDTWMAYDANSGGHATRVHARSLRGYTIVNPHA